VELIKTFVTKMQECRDDASKTCNVLDKDQDFNDSVTNWINDFGPAQEIPDVPFVFEAQVYFLRYMATQMVHQESPGLDQSR
jgi:hypothetical protein